MSTTDIISRPLYAISEELVELLDTAEMTPPEQQAEIQARIDEFLGLERAKVDRVAQFLAMLEYTQKDAGDEIARLQERKKAAEKAQERLEQYVAGVMKMRGVKKLEGRNCTLSTRQSDAVVITDERRLPLHLRKAKVSMTLGSWLSIASSLPDPLLAQLIRNNSVSVELEPMKSVIKGVVKGGTEVPGADLEFRQSVVRK